MTDEPTRFLDGRVTLYAGDCLDVLDRMDADSVDAVITDPPYHYDTIVERFGGENAAPAKSDGATGVFSRASAGFMGKTWDGGDIAFRPETWSKVLRVLKPGGHLAAFSAPKCVHKMAWGIEAAGFEVRDRIVHLLDLDEHVLAFLESLSVAQLDALFRMLDHFGPLGEAFWCFGSGFPKSHDVSKAIDKLAGAERPVIATRAAHDIRGGNLMEASQGHGRGKHEYAYTAAATEEARRWDGWGTALKPAYEPIVIARKPIAESSVARQVLKSGTGAINIDATRIGSEGGTRKKDPTKGATVSAYGNGLNGGGCASIDAGRFPANLVHDGAASAIAGFPFDGTISAARFFYTAKADAHDRIGSGHPTVKPLDLMQWLVRMLTPPGGTVLDLFAGTGTTGEAAFREGFKALLIERDPDYRADIARRMEHATAGPVSRRHAATKAKIERQAKQKAVPESEIGVMDDIFGGGGQAR